MPSYLEITNNNLVPVLSRSLGIINFIFVLLSVVLIYILQGRLFSYTDTHRHRLGANYLQLPVNCPYRASVANTHRDGPACYTNNQNGTPNYFPNSFNAFKEDSCASLSKFSTTGDVARLVIVIIFLFINN